MFALRVCVRISPIYSDSPSPPDHAIFVVCSASSSNASPPSANPVLVQIKPGTSDPDHGIGLLEPLSVVLITRQPFYVSLRERLRQLVAAKRTEVCQRGFDLLL